MTLPNTQTLSGMQQPAFFNTSIVPVKDAMIESVGLQEAVTTMDGSKKAQLLDSKTRQQTAGLASGPQLTKPAVTTGREATQKLLSEIENLEEPVNIFDTAFDDLFNQFMCVADDCLTALQGGGVSSRAQSFFMGAQESKADSDPPPPAENQINEDIRAVFLMLDFLTMYGKAMLKLAAESKKLQRGLAEVKGQAEKAAANREVAGSVVATWMTASVTALGMRTQNAGLSKEMEAAKINRDLDKVNELRTKVKLQRIDPNENMSDYKRDRSLKLDGFDITEADFNDYMARQYPTLHAQRKLKLEAKREAIKLNAYASDASQALTVDQKIKLAQEQMQKISNEARRSAIFGQGLVAVAQSMGFANAIGSSLAAVERAHQTMAEADAGIAERQASQEDSARERAAGVKNNFSSIVDTIKSSNNNAIDAIIRNGKI